MAASASSIVPDGSPGYVAGLFFQLATENFRKDDSYGPGMHRLQQGTDHWQ
jgi:hypothetical protein